MSDTVDKLLVKGFPPSLATAQYRGVSLYVVHGPASNNGYVVAPFAGVHGYDEIHDVDAPGGWTFFARDDTGAGVLGFDHAHSWDRDNFPAPFTVLDELRQCVDSLIDSGYIKEATDE